MSLASRSSNGPRRSMRRSRGAVITTTLSNRASPPVSKRSGISITASGRSTVSSHALPSSRVRGCSRRSSHSSSAGSWNTISPMRFRSPTASSPQRSRIAARTPSSSARSVCTNSSLDAVAAPCRANAASASLFPAAMPPVSATVTGRCTLLGGNGLVRALDGLGCRLRLAEDVFVRALVRLIELRLFVLFRLVVCRLGSRQLSGVVGEHVFGEIDRRRRSILAGERLHRHAVVDALERERKTAALGIDLEDAHAHRVALRDDLARVLDVVL